jgi:hypothetical protein
VVINGVTALMFINRHYFKSAWCARAVSGVATHFVGNEFNHYRSK